MNTLKVFLLIILFSGQSCLRTKHIAEREVLEAQNLWAKGMIEIAEAYQSKKDYHAVADKHVTRCYGYDFTEVLFRPTTVNQQIYRPTKEGAISYFVGGNPDFPNDRKSVSPLENVRFENAGIKINGNIALAMGRYYFLRDSIESVAEYAFAYSKNKSGQLKIIMHNSHRPYSP